MALGCGLPVVVVTSMIVDFIKYKYNFSVLAIVIYYVCDFVYGMVPMIY